MIKKSTLFYHFFTFENSFESLTEEHNDLLNLITKVESEPSQEVINNIMGFSHSYYNMSTKSGSVELMIN